MELAHTLLKRNRLRKAEGKNGSRLCDKLRGTLGEVLRFFGDGGSFGGTELPRQLQSKKAGLLISGLMRLGGASQELSAARQPV